MEFSLYGMYALLSESLGPFFSHIALGVTWHNGLGEITGQVTQEQESCFPPCSRAARRQLSLSLTKQSLARVWRRLVAPARLRRPRSVLVACPLVVRRLSCVSLEKTWNGR